MRIDAYAHALTEPGIDELEAAGVDSSVVRTMRNSSHLMDVDRRLADLDRYGIDKQVLTFSSARVWQDLPPDDGLSTARVLNDEIRRLVDLQPDRFVAVGTIPYLTGEYIDEFERCIDELDMAGVQILSHVDGTMLDDEAFSAFFEAVNDAAVPLWLHPQMYPWHDYDPGDAWLYKMMGWPFDTSVAVARLVLKGVLDRFENLQIVTHHLGGAIPYWEERMHSWVQSRTEDPELYNDEVNLVDLSEPVDTYFDRVYGDTAVSSRGREHTLRCGYEFFGPENVLFGVDYPYGPDAGRYWLEHTIAAIEGMDVPDEARAGIFGGNVERLIGL